MGVAEVVSMLNSVLEWMDKFVAKVADVDRLMATLGRVATCKLVIIILASVPMAEFVRMVRLARVVDVVQSTATPEHLAMFKLAITTSAPELMAKSVTDVVSSTLTLAPRSMPKLRAAHAVRLKEM